MDCPPNCPKCSGVTRRHFLRSLLPGALAASALQFSSPARAETLPKALVLTCIDFRFVEKERSFLSQQYPGDRYDLIALAGASLALVGFPHPAAAETFWDELELSYNLHHIQKVIILDHQDCGAYASQIDPDLSQDAQREYQVHKDYLNQAYWAIRDRYPELSVELYFITLNAEVQQILPEARAQAGKTRFIGFRAI